MGKVRAYIDGFNLYHNMQEYINTQSHLGKDFAWINTRKLIKCFIGLNQDLDQVFLFSAIPRHSKQTKQERHRLFYQVQRNICQVNIVDSRFGQKVIRVECEHCKHKAHYLKNVEKETDVALGVQVVHDVNNIDNLEKVIIVSGDTDFLPVIRYVLSHTEVKIKVLVPLHGKDFYFSEYLKTKNITKDLESDKKKNYSISSIKETHMKKARLEDELHFLQEVYKNPHI